MYLQNKYTTWYLSIISNAKTRPNFEGYGEIHHIIPKSLGGSNDPTNLVKLTAKEHFICHLLLTKMVLGVPKNKMVYALWCLANLKRHSQDRYTINSRQYTIIKQQYSKLHQTFKHTEEHKQYISQALKGKPKSDEHKRKMSEAAKNRKMSPEGLQKFREAHKNKQFKHTEEHKLKVSKQHKGKKLSEETKLKISQSQKLRYQ